jgi:hypothetical protein
MPFRQMEMGRYDSLMGSDVPFPRPLSTDHHLITIAHRPSLAIPMLGDHAVAEDGLSF